MAGNVTYKFAMDSEHRLYRDGTTVFNKEGLRSPPLNKGLWSLLDEQNREWAVKVLNYIGHMR